MHISGVFTAFFKKYRFEIRQPVHDYSFFYVTERLYTEDEVEWEGNMSASEAIATSLRVVTAPSTSQDASKSRRLAHLSALVKMWQKREAESDNDGLRLHEIMLW